MTTVTFEQVKVRAAKRLPCPWCNKSVARQTTIVKTVNPFNRSADGQPKTRDEVRTDCMRDADAWKLKAEPCGKCKAFHKRLSPRA